MWCWSSLDVGGGSHGGDGGIDRDRQRPKRPPRRSMRCYGRLSRVGDTFVRTDRSAGESSVLSIPSCGSRRCADGRDPRPSARTTLRVPRHFVVRANPYMSHANVAPSQRAHEIEVTKGAPIASLASVAAVKIDAGCGRRWRDRFPTCGLALQGGLTALSIWSLLSRGQTSRNRRQRTPAGPISGHALG